MHRNSVLVVEDDPVVLEAYRLHLEAAGFRVFSLEMAETLLQVYQLEQPDIILMDIQLPGMDGLQIMEKLRKMPTATTCRVIFISSHGDKSYIDRAFALGADDYLIKPINWTILTKRLQQMAQDIEQQKRIHILACTFNIASEGMIVTDTHGLIMEVNDSFIRITGYEQDEAVNKTPAILASGRHDKAFYEKMWQDLLVQGSWSGEIWNRRKNGEIYPQWLSINAIYDGTGKMSNFIGVFSDISHIKEQEALLLKQAQHDHLTGLPNRMLLVDRLQQALKHAYRVQTGLGVLFIDLDGFKAINDQHGHDAGDRVLRELAQRYLKLLRGEDTVARMGGDEFVVLVGNLHHQDEATLVADKILRVTTEAFDLGSTQARVGCSIGISTTFEALDNAEILIRQADEAMYQAKRSGKNRYALYQVE